MKKIITLAAQPFCMQPSPQIMVACRDQKSGKDNVLAVSFAANASIDEPMVIVGIVPERYSYHIIKESGCFSVNIPTKSLSDYYYFVGSVSGETTDKLKDRSKKECDMINCFYLPDCPVSLECEVVDSICPGTHELFVAKVKAIHCDSDYLSENNEILWSNMDLI